MVLTPGVRNIKTKLIRENSVVISDFQTRAKGIGMIDFIVL